MAGWIEEGLDLSAIQARLESELDISMTYMDVRFLVGDLELMPKDEEEPRRRRRRSEEEPVGAMPEGRRRRILSCSGGSHGGCANSRSGRSAE